MINKIIATTLLAISAVTYGQNTATPYSSYGLGERGGIDQAVFSGLGNNTVNFISSNVLNHYNPASYSYLKPQFPLFSLGVSSRFSTFESAGTTQKNNKTSLNDIALGMSLAKRFGFAFGLTPYSKRGYSFTQKFALGADSVRHDYLGNGDINRFFGGISGKILNYDSLTWSVGANFSALFGTIQNERRAYLINTTSTAGGIDSKTTRVKAFHYEIGTVLTKQFRKGHSLVLAGTFEPLQELTAYQNNQLFFTTTSIDNPNGYITLQETGELKGKITLAPTYTIGFDYSYAFNDTVKNRVRKSEIKVLGSYSSTSWSQYETRFNDTTTNFGYPDARSIHFGIQYCPQTDINASIKPNVFERMSYRIGFYNKTLPYQFNNVQLTEFGTSFGLGLPILTEKKMQSSIQLGITYGKRGTSEVGSLNETFLGLNLGLIISPSESDKWFTKRKLD
jgi:hypothetical protein